MKTRGILFLSASALMLSLGSMKADITYGVNLGIGAGGVTGSITTDGNTGVLVASDILSWNLNITGNGGATYNLVSGPSGVEVGNITQPFNPSAGTPDLTATATDIYFNFSATDGGYLGFQSLPFYGGQNYFACGAFNNNFDVSQGFSVVPVLYSDSTSIYVPEAGNQIIAAVSATSAPDLADTMPLLGLGLGALTVFGRRLRK
jgi:hypothetical protein